MKAQHRFLAIAIAACATLALTANGSDVPLAVYTASNSATGNEILAFPRNADGTLQTPVSYPTDGLGSGGSLGNQGGIFMSKDRQWLLVVNAGSNEVSVFQVSESGLILTDKVSSEGELPVSVTQYQELVYVLNAGDDSITGFVLDPFGQLEFIPYSKRYLSAAGADAAQISFSPWGEQLVVTEKATSTISVFEVCDNGYAEAAPLSAMSSTPTPFGFAFRRDGLLVVSEAAGGAPDASAASTYRLGHDEAITPVDPSVPTTETAACWLALHPRQYHAYTTNTGSNTLSVFRLLGNGRLLLIDSDGAAAQTGAGPVDLALTQFGRYLYTLNSGDETISIFRTELSGTLRSIGTMTGLPDGANGLVAN